MTDQAAGNRSVKTLHLVKGEDLNHHQTLYGGRCVEWCVHAAYIAAESCFDEARPVVFMSIRSLSVRAPARIGDIIEFTGSVDHVGDSTIGIRVDARLVQPKSDQRIVATGTFLFCTVDEHGRAAPHGLAPNESESPAARERWKRSIDEAQRAAAR